MSTHIPLATASATETPPDPGAAQKAQRETRRLIDMSRGILQAVVGAACLACAAVDLQPWWPLTDSTVIITLPLVILFSGMIAQRLVMQARKRAGIPTVTMPHRNTQVKQRTLLAVVLVVIIGAGAVVSLTYELLPDYLDQICLTLFMVVAAVPMVLRGVRLGLWEDVFSAVGIPIGIGMMMVGDKSQHIGWLCLAIGITQLIAGYFLHRRWQAWLKSLPKDSNGGSDSFDPAAGSEASA